MAQKQREDPREALETRPTEWLSVSETARLLGVSRSLVYKEAAAGRLPHRRFGRGRQSRVLINRYDLECYLAVDRCSVDEAAAKSADDAARYR